MRYRPKMLGITTFGIVAPMVDVLPLREVAIPQKICGSMCIIDAGHVHASVEEPVPGSFVQAASEFNTMGDGVKDELFHQPFTGWSVLTTFLHANLISPQSGQTRKRSEPVIA